MLVLAIVTAGAVWWAAFAGWLPADHPLLRWSMPWSRVQASRLQARSEHRAERLAKFDAENRILFAERSDRPPAPVVFLGSSTIERLPLAALFPGRSTLNRGIAAASIAQLSDDLPLCLPPVPVAGVVVFAGRVELLESDRSVEAITAELHGLLARIVEAAGGAPLCVLGLPPSRQPTPRERTDLTALDARIAELAREFDAAFVPLARAPLRDSVGALSESCSSDALHLNDAGSRQLAQWLVAEGGEVGRMLRP